MTNTMETYKIVQDEDELQRFISKLPDLTKDEKYYVTLFARKKYTSDTRFKSDKAQIKRLTVNKQDLFNELKKLEVAKGLYVFDGVEIPQEILAVYMNPNPRSMSRSTLEMLSRTADKIKNGQPLGNPKSEAMNCIQVTASRKVFFDIDIDIKPGEKLSPNELISWISSNDIINLYALQAIHTRGGYHVLVELDLIAPEYTKRWYQGFTKKYENIKFDVMMNSDNLIPIPGCVQGGAVPRYLNLHHPNF